MSNTEHEPGVLALARLLNLARNNPGTGQGRRIAAFLLSLYNGSRFKFDLTDFRSLDDDIFADCLLVLKMDHAPKQEVHQYFVNGGRIWEQLAEEWCIRDYTRELTV